MKFTKEQLSDWRVDVVKRVDAAFPNNAFWTYDQLMRYQTALYHELKAVDHLKLSLMDW